MLEYARSFGIAFAASLVLTFLVRATARAKGLVAKPRPDRWHRRATALFGGVAIMGAFLFAIVVGADSDSSGQGLLLFCSSAMFVVGLVDDILHLKPQAKLVAQIGISTLFTAFGLRLSWLPSSVLDQALTVFWLVGITNALNLLDNIDGAAAGIACIASAFVVYFSHLSGHVEVATMTAAFGGAVLGFLLFNFNPASIFMGDSGSLFLGFFLAGVVLLQNQGGARRRLLGVLLVPVLLFLIPILDTGLVTLSRSFHGRAVSQGGRDHTSHRLVALGLSDRAAALILWALAALSGSVAFLVGTLSQAVATLVVPLFGVGVLLFFVLLGRVRVYEPVLSEEQVRGQALLPTLHHLAYKRRIFEILCDSTIVSLAYYAAYLLRFEGEIVAPYYEQTLRTLPVVVVTQLALFLALGLYRGVWRYMALNDLPLLVRAVGGGWVASVLTVLFLFRFEGLSRSVFMIDGILVLLGVAGVRLCFRWFQSLVTRANRVPTTALARTLIYGAGDAGGRLATELLRNPELGLLPVGFVDDDPQKQTRDIHGLRVVGSLETLEGLLPELATQVVVSTNKLSVDSRAKLEALCRARGIQLRRARLALDDL